MERQTVGFVLLALVVVVGLGVLAWLWLDRPRADRDWAADQAVAPKVTLAGGSVRIQDLRDFRHAPGGGWEARYRDVAFELDDVRRVWFVLAPFADRWRGLAHTFLTFELTADRFIAVSVEARRERHETYSLSGGLLRRFEVAYVIGTEEDLVGLRALRGDSLYLYPAAATPEQARALLADVLARAAALESVPEFYNTLTNNCATNLRDHINRVAPGRLPWGWGMLVPGYSDALALRHGLLDTELPIEEARRAFRVDDRARAALEEGRPLSRAVRGRPQAGGEAP